MANIQKFNRQVLVKWRKKGKENPYFFQKAILQDRDLIPELHAPLINFLCGPELRKLVCGFRGSLKTSSIRAWFLHRGLYTMNWSSMMVEQKFDNAKAHLAMLQDKFKYGNQAGMLQDMYSHRIPPGFEGWTTERCVLIRTDPNAEPFLTVSALDAKQEGHHKSAIGCDDLEGADAEKSDVPNEQAKHYVYERAEPLLREPAKGEIVVGGTPHGKAPLVHELKRDPTWATWWVPILDEAGNSRWEKRFPQEWIETKQRQAQISSRSRRMWDMQYLLREHSTGAGLFDMDAIERNMYEIRGGRLITYPKVKFSKDPAGKLVSEEGTATVDLSACRFYLHCDPGHKGPDERLDKTSTPSLWAHIVVAVSPDFHAFVVESWMKHANYDEYLENFIRLYRKWSPQWTLEEIGAQSWMKHHLKILEKTKYRNLLSVRRPWKPCTKLPKPSMRQIDFSKSNAEKETFIIEQLEIPHNMGWLHLHPSLEELIHQHRIFPSDSHPIDGLDALAQGPSVWKPPITDEARDISRRRDEEVALLRLIEPITGYSRPWDEEAA